MTKRIISLLTTLVMAVSLVGVMPAVTAGALTYGDYYYEILDDGTIEITGRTGSPTILEIPSKIDGKTVTSIGYAFNWCTSLKSITIPNSVTSIGFGAFRGTSLTSITIPNSVISIGELAFGCCENLTNVTIGNSVTSVGEYAFYSCTSLTSITIGNSVASIGKFAFQDCTSLTSVKIPQSVTSIGMYAFYGCTSLKSVIIPDSITNIECHLFNGCTSLKSITIPNSVTSIEVGAFNSCKSLISITIPDSVTSIGSSVFWNCTSLTIKCYKDSCAEQYAIHNQIKYELIEDKATHYVHWKKKVTGEYKDTQTKKVLTDTEVYSDDYFIAKSTNVQGGLAKLSMLAASAVYTASAVYKKNYAEDLIKSCGFNIHKYVKKNPTKKDNDTVSYEIGIRNVDGITIVAVWVKGTSGDYEWVSNWNLGKGNTHKGFSKAEQKMNTEIEKYLKKNHVTLSKKGNVKLWVTGHSRGAAIANLYAKRMNKKVGKKNVYAYTYATPRVSVNGKKAGYENIFNYLNPGDFVTEVAPAKWGYKRYGVDKILTGAKKNSMKKEFKKLSGKKYNGFSKKEKKSLLKAFINYAGEKRSGYYKKKPLFTPEYFCKKGLGYALAGNLLGIENCRALASANRKCMVVFLKMIYDGKISKKFGYAHTQLGYLSWLKVMY